MSGPYRVLRVLECNLRLGGVGVLRVLTVHPDSPRAASGGFPGAGSHKSHCSPLQDMGFGPGWQSPTLSLQRTTVWGGAEGRELEGLSCTKTPPNTQEHGYTHIYIHMRTQLSLWVHDSYSQNQSGIGTHSGNFCAHRDMIPHAHIYTINGHMVLCVTPYTLAVCLYTYLSLSLLT